jgi:hypothetical protein
MNCGETRDIAAHGLCFKCYRQEERKLADELWARPGPDAKELAKNQRKTRKALMKMLDALEEIEVGKLVPDATTEAWRRLLRPEVERIALSLGEAQGNGELGQTGKPFIDSANEWSEEVNIEQQEDSEQFTDLSGAAEGQQERVSDIHEPPNQHDQQVNSEHEAASEPFTQSEATGNPTKIDASRSSLSEGTEQTSNLPPAVRQRVTKMKKTKESDLHAA